MKRDYIAAFALVVIALLAVLPVHLPEEANRAIRRAWSRPNDHVNQEMNSSIDNVHQTTEGEVDTIGSSGSYRH